LASTDHPISGVNAVDTTWVSVDNREKITLTTDQLSGSAPIETFGKDGAAHVISRSLTGDEIVICYDTWKLCRFRRWKPLIYYCAFGHDEIFDLLRIALDSLSRFGLYEGAILVITDEKSVHLIEDRGIHKIPGVFFQYIAVSDILDFTLGRYRIVGVPGIDDYGPILYLDIDIVCDREIEPLLLDLISSDDICVVEEGHLQSPLGYWGAHMFSDDDHFDVVNARGSFSTGVIGARSAAIVLEEFRLVTEISERWCLLKGTRQPPVYDQPTANYVFNILAKHESKLLKAFVRSQLGRLDEAPDVDQRLGLVHFAGGVGNSFPKLLAMRQYVQILEATLS